MAGKIIYLAYFGILSFFLYFLWFEMSQAVSHWFFVYIYIPFLSGWCFALIAFLCSMYKDFWVYKEFWQS